MQEKLVPQNIEAEQNVLSAILIENKSITTVAGILKPEDFYRISHQLIYRAMLDLYAKHTPIDMVTVTDALKTADKLNDVGGVSYITLLANVAPTAANIKYHARIVAQKAALRKMVESGTAIAAMGYEGNGDNIRQLIDEAEKSLLRLTYRRSTPDCVPIHDILSTNVDRICSLVENRKAVTGLSTGFADLDYITAGLHPSDFIILAARPSM
ncbi:MAG: replicative DNA helicase, partial [Acidaminococcaceae bacterium]|nr:replicative DNA helicase [Acidaminococcaceae bacterium]